MSVGQIRTALDRLVEHGFAAGWQRHPGRRYWRVEFGTDIEGVETTYTPWYSQLQIDAWINGARAMGAAI